MSGRVSRSIRAAGRVCPVQGRVHRQQVGQVVAIGIHQLIDPLDAHGSVCLRFDGQRRGVVDQQASLACPCDSTIPPHGCRWQTCRQDLLGDLPHGNFVIVNVLASFCLIVPALA